MIVIGDTSGLVAALNVTDPEHTAARAALRAASATVVSPLVFLEVEHITTRNVSRRAAHAVNDWLLEQARTMRVLVPEISADVLRKARVIQNRYDALRLDLADAVNVVLAEAYETECVLTLDRRDFFRAVQPLTGHKAFRLLPDDL
ncbi:PIN domain-containing protein [Streptomyces sp. YC504]|uniref:Ribonuclease VapC n=1 Tax=Streptomyces mesophilus TaxID=1775132 RepID=A0A6G4XMC8_9ACTN|nr:PIN domain-containing protein [Streptomyces mesophilus]NGO77771.1 PIN domain-containing protein [Streptomyces mesophilus]